jgi:hypothetical protein
MFTDSMQHFNIGGGRDSFGLPAPQHQPQGQQACQALNFQQFINGAAVLSLASAEYTTAVHLVNCCLGGVWIRIAASPQRSHGPTKASVTYSSLHFNLLREEI